MLLDFNHTHQRTLDLDGTLRRTLLEVKSKPDPCLAISLEYIDITSTHGRSIGAGIDPGRRLDSPGLQTGKLYPAKDFQRLRDDRGLFR